MPQKIEVEGIGEVEFPDGLSDAELASAIGDLEASGQFANVVSRSSSTAPSPGNVSEIAARRLAKIQQEPGQSIGSRFMEAEKERSMHTAESPIIKAAVRALPIPLSSEILETYEHTRNLASGLLGEGAEQVGLGEVGQEVAAVVGPDVLEEVVPGGALFQLAKSGGRLMKSSGSIARETVDEFAKRAAEATTDEAREAAAAEVARKLRKDFEGDLGYNREGLRASSDAQRRQLLVRKKVRENIPLTPEERAEFAAEAAYQDAKSQPVVVDPDTGKEIAKNPPASPEAQLALEENLRAQGIDTTDPDAVAQALSEKMGVPKPEVTTGAPISKLTREEPRLPRKLNERLALSEKDLEFLRNLNEALPGNISWGIIPDNIKRKIGVPGVLDSLADELKIQKGQVGRIRNVSETGQVTWIGVKSSLPKHLQRGYKYDTIVDIIQRGLAGEHLSPKNLEYYKELEAWARTQGGGYSDDSLRAALWENGITAEAADDVERAAIQGEGGAPEDFSFGENARTIQTDPAPGDLPTLENLKDTLTDLADELQVGSAKLPEELRGRYNDSESADIIHRALMGVLRDEDEYAFFEKVVLWADKRDLNAAVSGKPISFQKPAYRAHTEAGKPSEILHEMRHIEEDMGGRPVPENNDQIIAEHLQAEASGQHGPPRQPETISESPHAPRLLIANEQLGKAATKIQDLGQKFNIVREQLETIEATGTIEKGRRRLFRESGDHPATDFLRASKADIFEVWDSMTNAFEQLARMEKDMIRGHSIHATQPGLEMAAIAVARDMAAQELKKWATLRNVFGRGVRAFGQIPSQRELKLIHEALSPDSQAKFAEIMNLANNAGMVKEQLPIWNNLVRLGKKMGKMTDAEAQEFVRTLVQEIRLNLFAVPGFTLDLVSNVGAIGSEVSGSMGRDLVRMARGDFRFGNLQGWARALKDRVGAGVDAVKVAAKTTLEGGSLRKTGGALNPRFSDKLAEEFGWRTAAGEPISGGMAPQLQGIMVDRSTKAGAYADYILGMAVYPKSSMDLAAKRLGATAKVWGLAYEQVPKGLKGLERKQWIQGFVNDPPEWAVKESGDFGRRTSFDRYLPRWEERVAGSTVAQLTLDAFARWPFQFSKWLGEAIGVNPRLLKKMATGKASAEEVGEYVAKSATGIGGLMFLKNTIYDDVDFNSMEYVHADGNRTRLAGREPIATALWLIAAFKGDWERVWAGSRHASVPFAKLLAGEGGLLTSMVSTLQRAQKNRNLDAEGFNREMNDILNRQIPGQAVLGFIETLVNPGMQEGLGANLPGVSGLLSNRIESTTGEELIPMQSVLGSPPIPTIGGTVIPGAEGIRDPIFGLLGRNGALIYRGPRSPIAGFPVAEIPEELRREWQIEFGKQRQEIMFELLQMEPKIVKEDGRLTMMKLVTDADSAAAAIATQLVNERHDNPEVPETIPRRLKSGPTTTQREAEAELKKRATN